MLVAAFLAKAEKPLLKKSKEKQARRGQFDTFFPDRKSKA